MLVASNHPLIAAVNENSSALQSTDIQAMPDQLVKIGTNLYDAIMPFVQTQIKTQVPVHDMNKFSITIEPANYSNWSNASDALAREQAAKINANLKTDIRGSGSDTQMKTSIDAQYSTQRMKEQNDLQFHPFEFNLDLEFKYNFLDHST